MQNSKTSFAQQIIWCYTIVRFCFPIKKVHNVNNFSIQLNLITGLKIQHLRKNGIKILFKFFMYYSFNEK